MITLTHQEHPEISLERLCALLSVSKSWYYEQRKQAEYDPEDSAFRDQIEHIILAFPGYGYRRVTHALSRQGSIVNHKRVLRIMRGASRCCAISKNALSSRRPIPVMASQCIRTF